MKCEEFPPASYDLYVLGLLGLPETERLNSHVERQCATCLGGVGRSMRLWGLFTSTLAAAEPSSHFQERLREITDLSRSVLTFPKSAVIEPHGRLPRWVQITIGTALAAMLTVCGWYAGHTSGSLDHQHLITKVAQSEQELSSSRLQIHEQQQKTYRANAVLTASGQAEAMNRIADLQDQLTRLQAEVSQYKAALSRKEQGGDNQKDLILLLSSPGARLVPLKATSSAPAGIAYAVVVPNSKLGFVASNLSDLSRGREYQLWIASKPDSKPKSAGVFVPDEAGRAFVLVDDGETVSSPGTITVTEEPAGGSDAPTGSRILTSED
jgi:anti-sigma-K factor RskA